VTIDAESVMQNNSPRIKMFAFHGARDKNGGGWLADRVAFIQRELASATHFTTTLPTFVGPDLESFLHRSRGGNQRAPHSARRRICFAADLRLRPGSPVDRLLYLDISPARSRAAA